MPSKNNLSMLKLQKTIDNLKEDISKLPHDNVYINKTTKKLKPQTYGLTDLINGKTPTFSGWDVDPTDASDITDGNTNTSCTTGSKILGAGWQYAYFEWNLDALYDIITSGFGGANATVGTPFTYVELYVNGAWYASFNAVSNWTDRPFMAIGGRCSKVRLGITAEAAGTITPDISNFHVWRVK